MSLQDITDTILAEAEEQKAEINQETERTCAAIREETAKHKQELRAQYANELERAKQYRREQARARASQATQRESERIKRAAIDRIYDGARTTLRELPTEDYIALVTKLAQELPALSTGQITIPTQREDETRRALKDASCELPMKASDSIKGGFIVVTDRAEYDYSFGRLLEATREDTELRVANILFKQT